MSLARYQLDARRFRTVALAALVCWFGHNLLVGSLPGMISDVVGFANCGIMLWRRPARTLRAGESVA